MLWARGKDSRYIFDIHESRMPPFIPPIIIGTGPGGGTLAYRLSPSGKKIHLLERGGYMPREKDNWSFKTVFIHNKYKAKETWRDKDGDTFHPGILYNVGGNSNYERWATRCLPGCQERKVEDIVPQSVLSSQFQQD